MANKKSIKKVKFVQLKNKKAPIEDHSKDSTFGLRILILLIIVFIVLFLRKLFNTTGIIGDMISTLKLNLGSLLIENLRINLIASVWITFFFLVLFILIDLFMVLKLKKINWGFILASSCMVFLFLFGFWFIQESIGYKNINFNLHSNGFGDGKIRCSGLEENIFVGRPVYCNYSSPIPITNVAYKIFFTFENYTKTNKSFNFSASEWPNFTAPENLRYILFEVNGVTKNKDPFESSVGYPYTYLTYEEYQENRKTFLSYILALIAIIFVTVPSAFVALRSLLENKKLGQN